MHVIQVRNVQEALPVGVRTIKTLGVERDSRNGKVLKMPSPVTTVYRRPEERVMFWRERDANPFFHLFESLWMLEGRRDVNFPAHFVKRMRSFSDDGKTFHGAYGYRWRNHFAFDQLQVIINTLMQNPDDRRCVLQMWDARDDLGQNGKDFPCNLLAVFGVDHEERLEMTVYNRSNDMVWGAYGANAVHFSVLQEFVARSLGREVGCYHQVSANFHAYVDTLEQVSSLGELAAGPNALVEEDDRDPYRCGKVKPFPLMQVKTEIWLQDLHVFMEEGPIVGLRDPFFRRVAGPMWQAHEAYKTLEGEERYHIALEILEQVKATDWRLAAQEWLLARLAKYLKERDDGVSYE